MPLFERPFNSTEELHETELEYCKMMFLAGHRIAGPAAMHYCVKFGVPIPQWVVLESIKMNCEFLCGRASKQRGRSAGPVNRYRKDIDHYDRACAIDEIREQREYLRNEVESLRKLPGPKARAIYKEFEKTLKELGTGNLAAFACASTRLKGTCSEGGADAIKKSYETVRKAKGNAALRYRILDQEFLRMVGVTPQSKKSKDKKITGFCNSKG